MSYYLKRHRAEYYDRLMAIREEGNWEGWLRFFLQGAEETAREATDTAKAILRLREMHRSLIEKQGMGPNSLRLLDLLFERPLVHVKLVRNRLGLAFVTGNKLVEQLEGLGLLEEITGGQRNRIFRYAPYLRLIQDREPATSEDLPVQATEAEE